MITQNLPVGKMGNLFSSALSSLATVSQCPGLLPPFRLLHQCWPLLPAERQADFCATTRGIDPKLGL